MLMKILRDNMYGQRLNVTQARVNGLVLIDTQLNSKRGNARAAL